jgi:hypothetical protein
MVSLLNIFKTSDIIDSKMNHKKQVIKTFSSQILMQSMIRNKHKKKKSWIVEKEENHNFIDSSH